MKTVEIRYGVVFGKGDSSDWIDDEIDLNDEESAIYNNAVDNGIPLEDVTELKTALQRAYEEIEETEIQLGIDSEDEFVLECLGLAPMSVDDLNELVAARDSHALTFFNLNDASDEELDVWDAYELDKIPTIAEFQKDFEPCSPFDGGWRLVVEFVDPNE